jgi:hypothetical protein
MLRLPNIIMLAPVLVSEARPNTQRACTATWRHVGNGHDTGITIGEHFALKWNSHARSDRGPNSSSRSEDISRSRLEKSCVDTCWNVQILIVQDGQRHSFSLGPATAMTEMDDEAYFGVRTLGLAPF